MKRRWIKSVKNRPDWLPIFKNLLKSFNVSFVGCQWLMICFLRLGSKKNLYLVQKLKKNFFNLYAIRFLIQAAITCTLVLPCLRSPGFQETLFACEYHGGYIALRDHQGLYLSPIGSRAVLKTRSNVVTKVGWSSIAFTVISFIYYRFNVLVSKKPKSWIRI